MRYNGVMPFGQPGFTARPVDPPTDVDAVTDAVVTASRVLVAVSARSVAAIDDSITLPQFRLLVVLQSRGPVKLTTLAEHLDVNPSSATRTVDRLINNGLVARRVNPRSRREVVVELTPAGVAVVDQVTARRRQEIAGIVTRMPAALRTGLVAALEAFNEASGEPPVLGASYDARDSQWS